MSEPDTPVTVMAKQILLGHNGCFRPLAVHSALPVSQRAPEHLRKGRRRSRLINSRTARTSIVAIQGRARRKIDALNDLASAHIADGMLEDAMKACIGSLQAEETSAAKALFVRLITTTTSYNNRSVRKYLIRALNDPWCRTGQLVPACLAMIKSNGEAGQCIERAVASWPASLSKEELFGTKGLAALAADDLLGAVLQNTSAAGLDFEHFLELARRSLLLDVLSSQSPDRADPLVLHFLCAIARQCYINEYVYRCTTEESEGVAWLRDAISGRFTEAKPMPGVWIAAFACYSPLSLLPDYRAPGRYHDAARVRWLVLATSERANSGEWLSRHSAEPDPDRRCDLPLGVQSIRGASLPEMGEITFDRRHRPL